MSTAKKMKVEARDRVGTITFENPERLNVLDSPSLERLDSLLAGLERDESIRVIVIYGERHFCAGADIAELKEKDAKEAGIFALLGQGVCSRIAQSAKPIIAAVDGYALGAGCEIALACDMRIASGRAKFGQPEINLGLVPGFGGTQRLARLIGIGAAMELVLTGRTVDAEEAFRMKLINSVAVKDVLQRSVETALLLAGKSPLALGAAKKLISEQQPIERGLEREAATFSECFTTEDHREGIQAFLEKRPPKFSGR